jgi:hypothetical protein
MAARTNESGRVYDGGVGTYRTFCVRLCDGFYFPVSFATTRGKVREDAARCERQGPSRSRLYFHRNSDQTVDDMVDLNGQPYTKLPDAFRFREIYVPDCTCHGNPWDAEAIARHEEYARNPLPPQSAPTATAAQSKAVEPRRRSHQTNWGYRSRRDSDAQALPNTRTQGETGPSGPSSSDVQVRCVSRTGLRSPDPNEFPG